MARRKTVGPVLIFAECLTCGAAVAPRNGKEQAFWTTYGPQHHCDEWAGAVVAHFSDQTMRLYPFDDTDD